jgi:HEAT repeat protein
VPQIEPLIARLIGGDDQQAEDTVGRLVTLGQAAVPPLMALLASPDSDHRWWAVRTLAALEDASATDGVRRALSDADPAVRQCAALGLRHRPSPAAIPDLVHALGDPDSMTARLAGDALASAGETATPALVAALGSPQPAARIEAARALAIVQDPASIPALFAALEDPSRLVEYWAEEALERMGLGEVYFMP